MEEKLVMAPDEQTRLIQTVYVAPQRQRYPYHTFRRFCTIALASILTAVFGSFLLVILLTPAADFDDDGALSPPSYLPWWTVSPHRAWPQSEGISYEELQDILVSTPKEEKAQEWSRYCTSGPHLAGKNFSQALWTKERWQEFGVQASIVAYDVYVNYPAGHRLALLESKQEDQAAQTETAGGRSWNVKYEAKLEEDVLEEDGTSGLRDRVPTFHGYSASGNVTAPYVFVNYGTFHDYEDLRDRNVTLEGKIALIKYGGIFRGLKVKRAQELGMVGAVIYSDPGDDGEYTQEHGDKTYPDGPAREPSSVQRGSTQFLSIAPGDPTTPGYPSKPGVPRQPVDKAIPSIPSIPISYEDALPLLKALNGHGPDASSFGEHWHRGGLGYKGVEYNTGPSPDTLALNLVNEQDYVTTPMWDVIGIINGTLSDEIVILGNHRDAWIAGGAGDPNSGSAAMNEVIRSLGKALEAGWKPLRTIVLASWDGEEYGLIGSTEWVEEYLPWLSIAAVAYLNVDVGTTGPHFRAAAAPLLDKLLVEVTQMVQSPNQTTTNQTVADTWNKAISTIGSGSDFTAFQDFAGVPCVDMGFSFGPDSAVYHYHSNYDSFDWMNRYGDPGFHYHVAITKIWALLTAELVEKPVIQFNATDYATALRKYMQAVEARANDTASIEGAELGFRNLSIALDQLHNASVKHDAEAMSMAGYLASAPNIPWWKWWERVKLFYAVRKINDKYKYLERQFLYAPGLDGRNWFKHVVFAPGLWTGYAGATFPGLVETVAVKDWDGARRWLGIIEERCQAATSLLQR